GELRDYGLARHDGTAEVAVEQAPDIEAVLNENRLVEAVFGAQLVVAKRIDAALARHGLGGIAREEANKKERQQGEPDEGRNHQANRVSTKRYMAEVHAGRQAPQAAHPTFPRVGRNRGAYCAAGLRIMLR